MTGVICVSSAKKERTERLAAELGLTLTEIQSLRDKLRVADTTFSGIPGKQSEIARRFLLTPAELKNLRGALATVGVAKSPQVRLLARQVVEAEEPRPDWPSTSPAGGRDPAPSPLRARRGERIGTAAVPVRSPRTGTLRSPTAKSGQQEPKRLSASVSERASNPAGGSARRSDVRFPEETKRAVRERLAAVNSVKRTGEKTPAKRPSPQMKSCRECLKSKPIAAFPNPRRARCLECGGQPEERSVRTVSGGAPGLGRRR